MFRFQSGDVTVSNGKITEYIIMTIIGYGISFYPFVYRCKYTCLLQVMYMIKIKNIILHVAYCLLYFFDYLCNIFIDGRGLSIIN